LDGEKIKMRKRNLRLEEKRRVADLVLLLNKINKRVMAISSFANQSSPRLRRTGASADRQQKEKITYPKHIRTGKLFHEPVLFLSNTLDFLLHSFIFKQDLRIPRKFALD